MINQNVQSTFWLNKAKSIERKEQETGLAWVLEENALVLVDVYPSQPGIHWKKVGSDARKGKEKAPPIPDS